MTNHLSAFGAWDVVGLAAFALASLGYHVAYMLYTRRQPLRTTRGKLHLYKRTWVKRVLDEGDQMLAVQSFRNLLTATSFLASSSLLVLAVTLNLLINPPSPLGHLPDPALLPTKLVLMVAVLSFSFFSFLLAIRYLNHVTVLIGADPDLLDHAEDVDHVTYLTNLLNRAGTRYTYGQRGFYLLLPLVAWILWPPGLLIGSLALLLFLAIVLDLQRWRPPKALRKQVEEVV